MTAVNRTFRCIDCHELTTRKRNDGQPLVCFECGVARSIANSRRLYAEGQARRAARQSPQVEV